MTGRNSTAVPRKDTRTNTWYFVVDLGPGSGKDGKPRERRQAYRRGFPTKKAAQEALDGIRHSIATATYVAPSRQTLAEYLRSDWLPSARSNLEESTWASYRDKLTVQVIPRIGEVQLQAVNASTLNRLYADLLSEGRRPRAVNGKRPPEMVGRIIALSDQRVPPREVAKTVNCEFPKSPAVTRHAVVGMLRRAAGPVVDPPPGLSPRTVRYIHTILHRALKDAVAWDRLVRNPADLARPPRERDAKSRKHFNTWTSSEVEEFLRRSAGNRYQPAWSFLVLTGCRRGEALGLRWPDLDLDAGTVSIHQAITTINHKIKIGSRTKTAKGRVVELDTRTNAVLRTLWATQAQERLLMGPGYQDNEFVFCHPDGRPYHPERFSREFDRMVERLGSRRITVHDLRHTWATLALKAAVPLKVVSERLGHSSISVTADIYSHVLPGMQTDAAEKVASLIFGA